MIASEPIRIEAVDGTGLGATVFRPPAPRPAGHVVLVSAAMGVRQSLYYSFAEHLAGRGVAVVTFDYRGIGNSRPAVLRGYPARLRDWGRLDLAGAVDWTRRAFPGRSMSVVAHSIGGPLLGLAANSAEVAGVLAFAAQSGYWRHWQGAGRLRVFALWFVVIPTLCRALGYFPARRLGLGEDLPAGVAREWAFWGRHPQYLAGRLPDRDLEGFRSFQGRLRAVRASDDHLAPAPAVRALLSLYPGARTELRQVTPAELGVRSIGHLGYFRERIGSRLWPGELDRLLGSAGP